MGTHTAYPTRQEFSAIDCDQDMRIVPCRDDLQLVDTLSRILAMIKLDMQDYAKERPWLDALP